jgi:hypothetical protein
MPPYAENDGLIVCSLFRQAKQQLRQIVELFDSVPLGGHQDSSVDAGSLTLDSPAEGPPQHSAPPTDADDEDDDDDDEHTAKLKIHYTPAEVHHVAPLSTFFVYALIGLQSAHDAHGIFSAGH